MFARTAGWFLVCLWALSGTGSAQAEAVPQAPSSTDGASGNSTDAPVEKPIVFSFATATLGGETTLSNGVTVTPSDWPTLIVATIPWPDTKPEDYPTCTGTLVGENVVLMAAHCVDIYLSTKPAKPRLSLPGGGEAELRCEMHRDYAKHDPRATSPRGSEDYALCLIAYPGAVPERVKSMQFDVVDARQRIEAGTPVLMSGYGCSDLRVVEGDYDWSHEPTILRIGNANVEDPTKENSEYPTYLTIRSPLNHAPALCPGDSGGPLFVHATVEAPNSGRRIVGVNSALAPPQKRDDGGYDIVSRIAATGNDGFRTWAESWLRQNKKSKPIICGINAEAGRKSCRS